MQLISTANSRFNTLLLFQFLLLACLILVQAGGIDDNARPFGGGIVYIRVYEKQETITWLGYSADWATPSDRIGKMVSGASTKVIVNSGTPFMLLGNGVDNICLSFTANNDANVKVNDRAKLTMMH